MAKINYPVNYSQFDPKWSALLLGNNTDPKFNFYNFACLLCQLADVCTLYGHTETPETLNEKLKSVEGFANGGEYVDGSLSKIYPDILEQAISTPVKLTDDQVNLIKSSVDNGEAVVLGIDYNPKTIAADFHFVGVADYSTADENNLTIYDSLGGRVHSLKDYLGWFKPSMRDTIEKIFIFKSSSVVLPKEQDQTIVSQLATVEPASALPANYGDIIHNSTEWGLIAKRYFPEINPVGLSAEALIERIDARVKTVTQVQEKIVNVPAAAEGYAATQWDQLISYLEIGKAPQDTTFEDVKRVIAGIKSRQTDLENQAKQAKKDSASKDVNVKNLSEDVITLTKQVLQNEKLRKAEINTLKQNIPTFDKLKTQYEGVMKEQQDLLLARTDELKKLRQDLSDHKIDSQDVVQTISFVKSELPFIGHVYNAIMRWVRL